MRTARATKDVLVASIVAELKPFRRSLTHDEIEKHIRKTLEGSRWVLDRDDRAAIHKNNAYIERLRGTIRRLVDQLSKAPAPVQVSAFSGMSRYGPYAGWGFLTELEEMEQRLLVSKGNAKRDPIKHLCAQMARNFFLFSEKLPSSSSKASPFRVVASLVYEYFTGKAEQDLERPCEAALRTIRGHPAFSTNSRKKSASLSQRP